MNRKETIENAKRKNVKLINSDFHRWTNVTSSQKGPVDPILLVMMAILITGVVWFLVPDFGYPWIGISLKGCGILLVISTILLWLKLQKTGNLHQTGKIECPKCGSLQTDKVKTKKASLLFECFKCANKWEDF